MLKQLELLSITAEGRYATAQELKFVRDYVATVELRLSAYEKIRDNEDEIMARLEAKLRKIQADIFQVGTRDVSFKCRRDIRIVLRNTNAALLINDLDCLREHILVWQRTLMKAFKLKHITEKVHTTMPKIIEQFLTVEEFALVEPVLQLNQAVLAC